LQVTFLKAILRSQKFNYTFSSFRSTNLPSRDKIGLLIL